MPAQLVKALMDDGPHRRIVLSRAYRNMGVGLVLGYPSATALDQTTTLAITYGRRSRGPERTCGAGSATRYARHAPDRGGGPVGHDRPRALARIEPGPPPAIDPLRHYVEGSERDVAAYVLTLDTINFGSGWFPTLRKRSGASGYFTVAWALADRFARTGRGPAQLRTMRADEIADMLGQHADHELMTLYAQALRELGRFLGERARCGRALGARLGTGARRAARERHAVVRRPRVLQARTDRPGDLALAGVGAFDDLDQLTIFADNLVPHVLRIDGVLVYDERSPRASTAGACCRPAARSARSAPARCTPARSALAASGVGARARQVAVEPRPGAGLQGAPAPPDADGSITDA